MFQNFTARVGFRALLELARLFWQLVRLTISFCSTEIATTSTNSIAELTLHMSPARMANDATTMGMLLSMGLSLEHDS